MIFTRTDWSWRKLQPHLGNGGMLGLRPCLRVRIRWDQLPVRLPLTEHGGCYRPHELAKAGFPASLAKLFDEVDQGWKYVDIWPQDPTHLHIEFLGYRSEVPRQPLQRAARLILALQEAGIPVEVHGEKPKKPRR